MKRVTLVVLGVLLGTMVLAQPGRGTRGQRGSGDGDRHERARLEEKLDLTDDQQKKIEEFRLTHRSMIQDLRDQLDIKHAELKAAISSDQPGKGKIDGLVDDINELRSKQFEQQIDHRMEVRAVLDDKQKILFDDMHHRKRGFRHRY